MRGSYDYRNIDCMQGMRDYPDKHFDLAIVDPPYGVGQTWKKDRKSKFYTHESSYHNSTIPGQEYFNELFRVSKNQIIWGGNYYTDFLPASKAWLVWDKCRSVKTHMAECELAWTSFQNTNSRIYEVAWNGFIVTGERYGAHPHEKPVKIYRNVMADFGNVADKILDTHVGSGSSIIAAIDYGFNITGFELDPNYYAASLKRIRQFESQLTLI